MPTRLSSLCYKEEMMKDYIAPEIELLDIVVEPRTEIGVGSNTLPPEDENW